MLQEIITYLIVAAAVIVAGLKIAKRFSKKKPKKVDFKKDKISMAHNCSDCASECVLRDLPQKIIAEKAEECDTTYSKK